MLMAQSYQKITPPQYVEALLLCRNKKVCTNLADELNRSHDSLYREFEIAANKKESTSDILKTIARRELKTKEKYLIFDDTQISKLYARYIEGLELNYDGSIHRACMGIKMITTLLSDGLVNIPIDAASYIGKDLAMSSYKTKSQIAVDIAKDLIEHFDITRMLCDAHFSTKDAIKQIHALGIPYLMKIASNRIVTINGLTAQLKNNLRLKRNAHVTSSKGTFDGIPCCFYAIKIETGSVVYLISNDQINPYEAINLYRIRWNIEVFHRVAKQYLGLKDCQMLSIEKQRQHTLYVMYAYAIASVRTRLMGLCCVEDYINHGRKVKLKSTRYSKQAIGENSCQSA
jgi:hypothetical protein